MSTATREVTAAAFDAEVLEASRSKPVVVDFWATWCGPCHQLAPVLEAVAARHAADVDVVKLDVDQAPAIAQRYQVQGIPAIKAFRDGRVVAELTGVQPEPVLEQLFASLAPSEADRLAAAAAAAEDREREPLLRRALEADPGHRDAVLALARLLVGRGEQDEARALLARLPADDEVRMLRAELALAGSDEGADLEGLRAAAADGDAGAALDLGTALAARQEHAEAVEHLLVAVADPEHREAAREALLAVFAVAGDDSELVHRARPRLAAALF